MRRKRTWLLVFSAAIMITALYHGNMILANPANAGFKATTLAQGRFSEFEVFNKSIVPNSQESPQVSDVWLSLQKTKGASDLYVQSNEWQVGGSTGWHTHPGHSLIIVTEGEVTEYEGNDPNCTPHKYPKGATLIDPGGDHVHLIRNESDAIAKTIAVQLVPASAINNRRIDADPPANCAVQ